MKRREIPLVLMLAAGGVVSIITFVNNYPIKNMLSAVFGVLFLFFIFGVIIEKTLDFFDRQNRERSKDEGEVIEKENGEAEDEKKTPEVKE